MFKKVFNALKRAFTRRLGPYSEPLEVHGDSVGPSYMSTAKTLVDSLEALGRARRAPLRCETVESASVILRDNGKRKGELHEEAARAAREFLASIGTMPVSYFTKPTSTGYMMSHITLSIPGSEKLRLVFSAQSGQSFNSDTKEWYHDHIYSASFHLGDSDDSVFIPIDKKTYEMLTDVYTCVALRRDK